MDHSRADVSTNMDLDVSGLHVHLVEAISASMKSGTIGPLIKEELKLKIQASRLAAGKHELPKPVFKEPEKSPLTEDELKRVEVRRERNRIAALKCRNKKKCERSSNYSKLSAMEEKNNDLKRRVDELEAEKLHWIGKLRKLNIRTPYDDHNNLPWTSCQNDTPRPCSRPSHTPTPSPASTPVTSRPSSTIPYGYSTPSPCYFQTQPSYLEQIPQAPAIESYLSQTCTDNLQSLLHESQEIDLHQYHQPQNVFTVAKTPTEPDAGFMKELAHIGTNKHTDNVFADETTSFVNRAQTDDDFDILELDLLADESLDMSVFPSTSHGLPCSEVMSHHDSGETERKSIPATEASETFFLPLTVAFDNDEATVPEFGSGLLGAVSPTFFC